MVTMKNLLMAAAGSVVMALGIVGEAGAFQLVYGETKSVGNGTARTWVELDHDNNPLSLGISFSEASLSGLPKTNTHDHDSSTHHDDSGMHNDEKDYLELPLLTGQTTFEYELLFPQVSAALPFTHMGFNWNDHGHGPEGVFDSPHFDIHFYTISPEERYAITAVGDDEDNVYQAPSQGFIPTSYVTGPGAAEPRMGLHWFDPTAPVFNGQTFTQTFIYGSYDGNTIFWEPMITKAFLETKPNVTYSVAQPEAYAKSGYYPTSYSIKYDEVLKEYSVSLVNLIFKSAFGLGNGSGSTGGGSCTW